MATPMADNTLYPVPPVAPDYAPPTVEVEPKAAYVVVGQTVTFSASVYDGAGEPVTDASGFVWSVNGRRGGDSDMGLIGDNGTFHAPFHTPNPSAYEIGCRYEGAVGRAVVSIVPTADDIPKSGEGAIPSSPSATTAPPTGTTTTGGNP